MIGNFFSARNLMMMIPFLGSLLWCETRTHNPTEGEEEWSLVMFSLLIGGEAWHHYQTLTEIQFSSCFPLNLPGWLAATLGQEAERGVTKR